MKAYVFCALLLFGLIGTVEANGQSPQKHDGYWWASHSLDFRVGFVSGYTIAMNRAVDIDLFKCLVDKKTGKVAEQYSGEKACLESSRAEATDFSGFRAGQWSDGIDEFYKDFRNRGLDIDLAFLYVKGQLRGKSAKELEEEATRWRRAAAPK